MLVSFFFFARRRIYVSLRGRNVVRSWNVSSRPTNRINNCLSSFRSELFCCMMISIDSFSFLVWISGWTDSMWAHKRSRYRLRKGSIKRSREKKKGEKEHSKAIDSVSSFIISHERTTGEMLQFSSDCRSFFPDEEIQGRTERNKINAQPHTHTHMF